MAALTLGRHILTAANPDVHSLDSSEPRLCCGFPKSVNDGIETYDIRGIDVKCLSRSQIQTKPVNSTVEWVEGGGVKRGEGKGRGVGPGS